LLEFLLQSRGQTRVHAATTTEHNSLVQTRSDIDIGALDSVEEQFSHTGLINIHQMGLEETLGGLESLTADTDDTAVGKGVGLDQNSGILGQLLVQLKVVGNVAELLLDLADGLEIGGSVQRIAAAQKKGNQVAGDIPASHIQSLDVVVQHS
jgi:hypothetical protein